jgi:peptidoglycan/xylan/chitin deacetylase (PgdA/CDA1 family)
MSICVSIALLLGSTGESRRAVALTYHDILPKKTVWFDCTPTEFRDQVNALKRANAHFATPREIENLVVRNQPIPARSVLITFADNYRGFYKYALPILKKERIPCIMFVHTGFVGSTVNRPKMTWAELAECQRNGVTVGSQTVTHRSLAGLTSGDITRELFQSRADIAKNLKLIPAYLAYPNGSYDSTCVEIAKSVGYRMAFAETQTPITTSSNPYIVPRYVHTKWRTALDQIL